MPLYRLDLDVADEDTDGLAVDLTGVGPWDVADFENGGATPDGLAHQLSLTSTANLSGITITITGTDADGNAISESRAGPNNNTVELAKYFKTIETVTAGATLGANTMDVGFVDEVASATYRLNWRIDSGANFYLDVTGTLSADVKFTNGDLDSQLYTEQESLPWFVASSSLDDETADIYAQAPAGLTGFRVVFNSYSSGAELQVYVSQADARHWDF